MEQHNIKSGRIDGVVAYQIGNTYLVRGYNYKVKNPSSMLQVNQRAKIKLLSQLGALFRCYMAIFPQEGKSARSIWRKINFPNINAENGQATTDIKHILLSDSERPLPDIDCSLVLTQGFYRYKLSFTDEPTEDLKRVFYYIFTYTEQGDLINVDADVQEIRNSVRFDGYFPYIASFIDMDEQGHLLKDYVVFAVGMGDNSEEASIYWHNLQYDFINEVGTLIRDKKISAEDFYFTQSKTARMNKDTQLS